MCLGLLRQAGPVLHGVVWQASLGMLRKGLVRFGWVCFGKAGAARYGLSR